MCVSIRTKDSSETDISLVLLVLFFMGFVYNEKILKKANTNMRDSALCSATSL